MILSLCSLISTPPHVVGEAKQPSKVNRLPPPPGGSKVVSCRPVRIQQFAIVAHVDISQPVQEA